MLEALRSDATLIAGAYAARELGACPLLAAHRRGGREHGRSTFAGEWDRFTRTPQGRPRLITEGEREVLERLILESLPSHAPIQPAASSATQMPLAPVPSTRLSERGDQRLDADRSAELSSIVGWAWLGVYRRLDDYEAALASIRQLERSDGQGPGAGREEAPSPPANEATRCFVES